MSVRYVGVAGAVEAGSCAVVVLVLALIDVDVDVDTPQCSRARARAFLLAGCCYAGRGGGAYLLISTTETRRPPQLPATSQLALELARKP
jgi:hypothetical protein